MAKHGVSTRLALLVGAAAAVMVGPMLRPALASENIHLFRCDSGLMVPHGPGLGTWGAGVSLEPKVTLLDPLVVGLRFEGAGHMGGEISGSSAKISQYASTAVMAKAEFYPLPLIAVRPFVGFGAGVFNMGGQNVSAGAGGGSISQSAGRYFGVAPQVGLELGRLRLALGYNAILGADVEVRQQVQAGTSPPPPTELSRNFVHFELGVRFGGGRKPPRPAPVAAAAGPAAPAR
jgi:hypothetical protein